MLLLVGRPWQKRPRRRSIIQSLSHGTRSSSSNNNDSCDGRERSSTCVSWFSWPWSWRDKAAAAGVHHYHLWCRSRTILKEQCWIWVRRRRWRCRDFRDPDDGGGLVRNKRSFWSLLICSSRILCLSTICSRYSKLLLRPWLWWEIELSLFLLVLCTSSSPPLRQQQHPLTDISLSLCFVSVGWQRCSTTSSSLLQHHDGTRSAFCKPEFDHRKASSNNKRDYASTRESLQERLQMSVEAIENSRLSPPQKVPLSLTIMSWQKLWIFCWFGFSDACCICISRWSKCIATCPNCNRFRRVTATYCAIFVPFHRWLALSSRNLRSMGKLCHHPLLMTCAYPCNHLDFHQLSILHGCSNPVNLNLQTGMAASSVTLPGFCPVIIIQGYKCHHESAA